MSMADYRFTYPSVLESEERFLDDVEGLLRDEGIENDLRHGLLLTLSEAFTNAMVHGNKLDPSRVVAVTVRVTEEAVTAEVADEGDHGLDGIRQREDPGELADHGRGLGLMEHFAATVAFGESPTGGLKVCLQFDRKRERIGK